MLNKTIKSNLVEFPVVFASSAKPLWINTEALNKLINGIYDITQFFEEISFVVPDNEFFEEITLNKSISKSAMAERYGGMGVGVNGGGARSGNIGNFQIKGIGRNLLAGQTCDHWHSYGGLNLIDAIYETINSQVYGKILPIGVAQVYGILITGEKTAVLPGSEEKSLEDRRGYGALLIREPCVRPAHYFPCPNFHLQSADQKRLCSDTNRVRKVSADLASIFNNEKYFVLQIGKFVSNYASQLAFSRAARIYHGSMSPSNMCLDGRWLDLTNTTFLEGGKNNAGLIPFYSEPEQIGYFIEEFFHTYSKYNQLNLNPAALLHYYRRQFQSYFVLHCSYVLGINIQIIPGGSENIYLQDLASIISEAIGSSNSVTTIRPLMYREDDPILSLLNGIFISIFNLEDSIPLINKSNVKQVNHHNLSKSLVSLLRECYEEITAPTMSFISFIKTTAYVSIKRALIMEYFFMGRLENYIYEIVKGGVESEFLKVIENSIEIASWSFGLNETPNKKIDNLVSLSSVVLFKSGSASIEFNYIKASYSYNCGNEEHQKYFESCSEAINYFKTRNHSLVFSEYDFSKYLNRLGYISRYLDSTTELRAK